MPKSLHTAFHTHSVSKYRNDNLAKALERRSQPNTDDNRFRCEFTLPITDGTFPAYQGTQQHELAHNATQACDSLTHHDAHALQEMEENEFVERLTAEQRHAQLAVLHECMDQHLAKHDHRWDHLLRQGSAGQYLKLFATSIEEAVIQHTEAPTKDALKLRGRATVNTHVTRAHNATKYHMHENTTMRQFGRETVRLADQLSRLKAIKACIAKNAKAVTNRTAHVSIQMEIVRIAKAFQKHYRDGDPDHDIHEQPPSLIILSYVGMSPTMTRLSVHSGLQSLKLIADRGKCTIRELACWERFHIPLKAQHQHP